MHKLRLAEQQDYRLCGYDKEDNVHIVCDCPASARKRYDKEENVHIVCDCPVSARKRYDKEDNVHIVCDCPVSARKIYRTWGNKSWRAKNLVKVRLGSLF
jgi:hypothetical protein